MHELRIGFKIAHELQLLSSLFEQVLVGVKFVDVRKESDFPFEFGQVVQFQEIEEGSSSFFPTGRSILVEILHTYRGVGIEKNFVAFGFRLVSPLVINETTSESEIPQVEASEVF